MGLRDHFAHIHASDFTEQLKEIRDVDHVPHFAVRGVHQRPATINGTHTPVWYTKPLA
jgi:hypothetical protein